MDSHFNAGCMLVLTQAKFPPFLVKPGGSALSLIVTPGWNILLLLDGTSRVREGGSAWPFMILISAKKESSRKK